MSSTSEVRAASQTEERGRNYDGHAPPLRGAEPAVEATEGLDFLGRKSVNPEDPAEGRSPMSNQTSHPSGVFSAAPPPLKPIVVELDENEITTYGTPNILEGADAPPGSRAVTYLRVSSKGQVNTDYDPEGISIPAQRTSCQRKAEQLGLTIVAEYVEPGRSATEMTKRVAFQEMLERIRRERDVDYVIVYKLSRFARNRTDDAIVMADLQKRGVTLVSATESIDATPVGQLMHGILAAFNEYRSREDGADIAYKMAAKAKNGGTLGRAPLGYLNVTENIDGRKINTVAIDEERAPYVKLAFEMFATGNCTYQDIADELTERGLLTRPTARRPAWPVSDTKIQQMLRDRYYLGEVTYKGETFKGRRTPLIDPDLFDLVQGILDTRGVSGERRRRYTHYLKGSLWCGHCRLERNVNRRLIQQRSIGRHGGEYWYFFCRGVQDGTCDAPFANVDNIEAAVEEHYKQVELSPDFIRVVREQLEATLRDEAKAEHLRRTQLEDRLVALQAMEDNLLDLAADASLPRERIRERLRDLAREREAL
ncbi:recombinase family protein [Rathayibacter sp. AY2B5]|nr:recombinase family protein [Rathayibacter sp. AY2B5]